MTDTLTTHWDHVYATKADDRVSWFEPSQEFSLELIADRALLELRGSAFGVFNLAAGVAMLFASVVAGLLWDGLGASWTFLAGAGFAAFALIGLALNRFESETVST